MSRGPSPCPAGGLLLWQCGLAGAAEQASERLGRALDDGSALRTFEAMLGAQGVPPDTAHRLCSGTPAQRRQVLGQARLCEELPAPCGGEWGWGYVGSPQPATPLALTPHSPHAHTPLGGQGLPQPRVLWGPCASRPAPP